MKEPIVILHGWGSLVTGEGRFGEVKKILEKKGYIVFTPDLPGFGSNTLKKEELFFEDYITFVKEFIEKNKLKKIVLIGHSFGGRIAIAFSSQYPKYISKLILVSASGIPHPLPSLKKKIVYIFTKICAPIFAVPPFSLLYQFLRKAVYYSIGEMDYYKAGNLKKTFKNVYQVSIVPVLKRINIPTLIIWGENDTITPVADAKKMHTEIKNSRLIIIPNATHKFPYENPKIFCQNIVEFLR